MVREFAVVVERDSEGEYVATVLALEASYTQAPSLDELMVRVREVIELCLEEEESAPDELSFVGVQRVRIPA